MRTFFILLGKELRAYFQSIVAYIVLGAVMLLHGLIFLRSVKEMRNEGVPLSLNHLFFLNTPFWLIFILIVPLITMRLFSEEQKMGTLEPLLTAPVKTWHLVFSKYCAAVIFYMVLYLPCMVYLVYFEKVVVGAHVTGSASAALASPAFYGGYVMIFLIGLFFVSVGCLTSALTSNQIIAAVMSFTILLIYFLLGYVRLLGRNLPEITVEFLDYISPIEHMRAFAAGVFDTRPFVYYISFAIFTLALTHQVLDYRKWKV